MADGTKVLLEFEVAGADKAVAEVKKVEKAEESLSLQQQLEARGKGKVSALATEATAQTDLAALEARRAAAKIRNAASEAEALEIRIARGAEAARQQATADLEQVLAAREKILLEGKRSEMVLQNALSRAVLPASRLNEAGRSILKDEVALASLGRTAAAVATGPIGILAAVFAGLAVVVNKTGEQFDRLKEVFPKIEDTMPLVASILSPWQTIKSGMSTTVGAIGSVLDTVFLSGAYGRMKASVDEAVNAQENAKKQAAAYKTAADAHTKMANDMRTANVALLLARQTQEARLLGQQLEDNAKIGKAQSGLAASQDKIAGKSSGAQAVNGVDRSVTDDQNAMAILTKAEADAYIKIATLMTQAKAETDPAKRLQIDALLETAYGDLSIASQKIATTGKEQGIQLAKDSGEAMATVTENAAAGDKELAAKASAEISKVQAEQGGVITAAQQSLRDSFDKIAANATGTKEETEQLSKLLGQLRNSTIASSAASQAVTWECINQLKESSAESARQAQALAAIKQRFIQIQSIHQ